MGPIGGTNADLIYFYYDSFLLTFFIYIFIILVCAFLMTHIGGIMKLYLQLGAAGLLLLLLGYAVGRYAQPARVVERKVEVIKEVQVEQKERRVVERRETRKDGTVVEERIDEVVDRRETEQSRASERNRETLAAKPAWQVSVLGSLQNSELQYGALVQRRILGPITMGAFVLEPGQAGLSLGFEF